ncbi:TetR/AcrR family transcriptional regulator C-terminal domain-containing protein [Planomonospora sp. ID67723]|uniref:TetR/AcrR family transcriptional regulator C-terminal domain-containing protein n=1 Tax=Planomonospora sp. ID67723 TaxID=2738134 RepID=UPI0027DD2336|nr:TetR/AcrR family transcriptional regulator C-terminal domain-containing protein [Planomonospora sp. ID67723]
MEQPFTSVWTREPRPAKSPGLGRDQIVRTAMALLDAEGVDALSMRRLGARLGSGATSIYWHVASKDELLELVMDEVFGEVSLPDPGAAGWRGTALAVAYGLRNALFAHPWAASLIGTRPAIGPNAVRLAARMLDAFERAGFREAQLDYASAALLSFVLGATAPEVAWQTALRRSEATEEEVLRATREMVAQVARDHPGLVARHKAYDAKDIGAERALSFDFGLSCLLDGLEARLAAPDGAPRQTGTSSPAGQARSDMM